ncbi:MAG: HDOD domain-containing protein [Gammaproteobacteria bacterium]|nr:MAG: HDOD domain-containing protein [Gammaproteobacteria bacterium]
MAKRIVDKSGLQNLERWVNRIVEKELPALGHTVESLSGILSSKKATANDLSNIILADPGMTSTILRVANSAYYRTTEAEITTVSRAVVLLGFEAIRCLSMSVSVMDKLLKGDIRQRQLELMAQSMFAASQAKSLAIKRHHPNPEEVFIATLLYNLGEMAFWCFSSQESNKLDELLKDPGIPRAVAEKDALGFRFSTLTRELSLQWKLGDTVREALIYNDGRSGSPEARNVVLSHQIESAIRRGWDSPVLNWVYQRTSDFVEAPVAEVAEIVEDTAEKSQETADTMGIDLSWRVMPPKTQDEFENIKQTNINRADKVQPQLQDQITSEIEKMISAKPDVQLILRMILEGIHRGGSMDRTVLAILTPARDRLMIRFQLGDERHLISHKFNFHLNNPNYRLFQYLMRKHKKPAWINSATEGVLREMTTHEIFSLIGHKEFLVAPLVLNGKDIGLIISDRAESKRKIDMESFKSFASFSVQANRCLEKINESPIDDYISS